jgi:hypothetical protein
MSEVIQEVPQNRTGSSFHSKAISKHTSGTLQSAEQAKLDQEFRTTATDLRDTKLQTSLREVKDSGLDYTMINLTTIDKIDEELMYRPILNVSVIGRLDNLKVSIQI